MRCFSLALLFLGSTITCLGQNEFLVNSSGDSTQRDAHIARDAMGHYAVVWNSVNQVDSISKGDIYLQWYTSSDQPIGIETPVNQTTAGDQIQPSLEMNDSGYLVIAWASYSGFTDFYDIKARRFRNGAATGNEFTVNTTTLHTQMRPAVTVDDTGNFVISWDSWHQDGSDRGIFAQRFDSSGAPAGTEFQLNTTTAYSQMRPAVKYFPDGRWVAIWQSWDQDASSPEGYGIVGRIFEHDGSAVTGEIAVNTYTADYQWFGDVETFADGTFLVVWCSWEQDGADGGIFGQMFNSGGTPKGSEFQINTTSPQYQWLPKVRRLPEDGFAVAWSSWKQDGSREGVFAQLFDSTGRKTSFETQANTTSDGFQWEPDLIVANQDSLLVVWSSWGQTGNDYDVIARRVAPVRPQGLLARETLSHSSGRSSSSVKIHVVDSTVLTGNSYEVGFDSAGTFLSTRLLNLTTGDTLVNGMLLNRGDGISHHTPVIAGFVVEVQPTSKLTLATDLSYFVNNSGTNLLFTVEFPAAGMKLLAPIDVALIWGNTDQLPNGGYVSPLDTALGNTGARNVVVPFRGWNLTDNNRVELLVLESPASTNLRFDPGERVIVLTPEPYRATSINSHAQVSTMLPAEALISPAPGDTNVIVTRRPLTNQDRYQFSALRSLIVSSPAHSSLAPFVFELNQNYPNPFNPVTIIEFTLPAAGVVDLSVYNILGERVASLVHGARAEGWHRAVWDASRFSSGVYFYSLRARGWHLTKKMLLVK